MASNPPPSPTELSVIVQVLQNPENYPELRATLASAMATQPSAPTDAVVHAPDAPLSTPSGSALITGVLNPAPVSSFSDDAGLKSEKKHGGSKRTRPPIEPPNVNPRRSERVVRQARKGGPGPAVHVNLVDDEGDSPPAKQTRSKPSTRRRLPTSSTGSLRDETSSTPDDEEVKKSKAPNPDGNPEKEVTDAEYDDNRPLTSVLNQLRRTQIKEGKRTAVGSNVAETPPVTQTEEDTTLGEDEDMFADSDVEVSKAKFFLFYDKDSKARWVEYSLCDCYSERKIDEVSFSEQHLIQFFRSRGLYSSVMDIIPYSKQTIQVVYSNMSSCFGNILSNKYGKVYYKKAVYTITPGKINEILGSPDVEDGEEIDLDVVVGVIY